MRIHRGVVQAQIGIVGAAEHVRAGDEHLRPHQEPVAQDDDLEDCRLAHVRARSRRPRRRSLPGRTRASSPSSSASAPSGRRGRPSRTCWSGPGSGGRRSRCRWGRAGEGRVRRRWRWQARERREWRWRRGPPGRRRPSPAKPWSSRRRTCWTRWPSRLFALVLLPLLLLAALSLEMRSSLTMRISSTEDLVVLLQRAAEAEAAQPVPRAWTEAPRRGAQFELAWVASSKSNAVESCQRMHRSGTADEFRQSYLCCPTPQGLTSGNPVP